MPSSEQKKKLLKAKIAVALHSELGRVPKEEEIDQVFLLSSFGTAFQEARAKAAGGKFRCFDSVPELTI